MKVRVVLAAAALLLVSLVAVSPASAQYTGGQSPNAGPTAGPVVQVHGGVSPAKVQAGHAGRVTRAARARTFALTGADIAQLALIGGAFVLGGAVVVRYSRRRVTPGVS